MYKPLFTGREIPLFHGRCWSWNAWDRSVSELLFLSLHFGAILFGEGVNIGVTKEGQAKPLVMLIHSEILWWGL